MSEDQIIGHGAEATVYKRIDNEGNISVLKIRHPKKYRHPELDRKLNQSRVKSEGKTIEKLFKKGMLVPKLHKVDVENYSISMSYIKGMKLKSYLIENEDKISKESIKVLLKKLGRLLNRLHEIGIIHGDLTTSNMILVAPDSSEKIDATVPVESLEIALLDFGLSYVKSSAEDKAVDLYVLERAFVSTHPSLEKQFTDVLIEYNEEAVLKRLEVVKQRGRKKVAFG